MTLIIGGGVYGAAVAWHLARRGEAVELLEAKTVASGASGGPGRRGVRANCRDHRELPLMARARALWPTLHEQLGTDPLFERTGHLQLIERPVDMPRAETRAALQSRFGIATSYLSEGAMRELEPDVASFVKAALHCPDDGVAFHAATTRAYADNAVMAGATIREGVTVDRLVTRDGKVVAVATTDGDEIPVPGRLFVLANSGVRSLIAPWLDLPTWNLALQVLVSKPLAENPVRHLVGHASRTLSLKREPDGRLMISGGRLGHWDYATGRGTPIPEEIAANVADAVAVYPSLEGIEIETADTGHLEAESIDSIPMVDHLPGNPHVVYAAGWTGHGWAIAPAVAELLADWALEGRRPELLAPFAFDRFAIGR
ncbi:FAD-binding oxidoreductase [Thalassobaculum sp. OXR-137]|uniref:NAD(P)/FAD-dependent oxidoreductase n=1 Tax=Thalassobaculum sp. OXR-137 TaxID=3100173 RepID=UPI002AC98083|nr:FAD-binding oxidoreductase [Thalassobaculum sp. OXR-137]WPZ36600.1 FAD-binding oxidoreductase [Thalassobaculum sp. OXR-137]